MIVLSREGTLDVHSRCIEFAEAPYWLALYSIGLQLSHIR
jgi:hypothetical protein